jgi:hypothetical protein
MRKSLVIIPSPSHLQEVIFQIATRTAWRKSKVRYL